MMVSIGESRKRLGQSAGRSGRLILPALMLSLLGLSSQSVAEVDSFGWFIADQSYHLRMEHLSLVQPIEAQSVEVAMASNGHLVDVADSRSMRGWQAIGEVRLQPWLGIELGVTKLSAAETGFSATTDNPGQFADDMVEELPTVSSGVLLGAVSSLPVDQILPNSGELLGRFRLRGRVGLHRWEGKTTIEAGSASATEKRSGTAGYASLGMGMDISDRLEAVLEYQRIDGDTAQTGLSIGIRYQFW